MVEMVIAAIHLAGRHRGWNIWGDAGSTNISNAGVCTHICVRARGTVLCRLKAERPAPAKPKSVPATDPDDDEIEKAFREAGIE